MDEKNMLSDEELDQVVGGRANKITGCFLQADGRVLIYNSEICSCHNARYFVDKKTGRNGIDSGRAMNPCCDCKYYSDGYCSNPDFAASLKG